jgi:hypothetical protein
MLTVKWNPALHPRGAVGSGAGGQFVAGSSAKAASAKPAAKAKPKTTAKNTTAAKAAQAKAGSVPFAELKKLTTMANDGKKLTPAQMAIVKAGETAHADHVAHEQHLTAVKAKTAKPKTTVTAAKKATAKTTAKKTTVKPAAKATVTAKPKAAAKVTVASSSKPGSVASRL